MCRDVQGGERRGDPSVIFLERLPESVGFFRIVGRLRFEENFIPYARLASLSPLDETLPQFLFFRRAGEREGAVVKMLDAADARVRSFQSANFDGEMSGERNVLPFRLISHSEEGIA